jgi:DnaJ-class molecular chaperone
MSQEPAGGSTPDEELLRTPGAAENLCPECSGSGRVDGNECATCGGSGKVIEEVGGA